MLRRGRLPGLRARSTASAPTTVLLAGEPDLAAFLDLEELLSGQGVEAVRAADGAELLFTAGDLRPAVVVVAADLPVVPLATTVTVLRGHLEAPVFVAIGPGDAGLVEEGLAAGATGVLTRPYGGRGLDATLADRLALARSELARSAVLRLGALELDSLAFRVTSAGRVLDLTLREFELLRFLMLNADVALTVDDLRDGVWGVRGETASANTVAVHLGRLRTCLAGVAEIVNIRGYGYRFRAL